MSFYNRHILPFLIEKSCAAGPIRKQREKVVPLAAGRVLEIGAGGGLNLAHYNAEKVDHIWGLDTSPKLLKRAVGRAQGAPFELEPLLQDAREIPLENGAADTVLVTYTLCSIADLQSALSEMRRVLKPGGRLIFCEHGAAPDANVLRTQQRLTPIWKHFSGNCHLDRDMPVEITTAGFDIGWNDAMYLPGTPRFAGFNRWGVATPR